MTMMRMQDVEVEADNSDDSDEEDEEVPAVLRKWKKKTLAQLFGGATKKPHLQLSQEEIEAEGALMEALRHAEADADAEEDAQ
ncbi:hypothetical protein B0H10DRAFT_2219403 [Mycena sp. CBHHK59/15]|nr:hypothetical protein B0H10DRAFT_2219403 [Mycena sp. CBHHK59/15]